MSDRLENNKVAARYARALFDSAVEANEADAVLRDLETVDAVFTQLPNLMSFFENPGVPAEQKQQLVRDQLGKGSNLWVARILNLLVENNRMPVFPQLVGHYRDMLNQRENVGLAEVVTAVELEGELRERIRKTLQTSMGFTRVELESRVDPGILGGIIIKVQDRIIDGSYVGRLEELRKQLING